MSLRIGNRVFAPSGGLALLAAALLATCVALGWWQIGRGREKQAFLESFARGTQTSVELTGGVTVDELPRFQHASVTGRYDPARQVLLDNMPSQHGKPGYRVLTPFVRDGVAGEKLLLVDRGWLPLGASREVLPAIDVSAESRAVAGRLDDLPAPGVRVGQAAPAGETGWPRVMNFPLREDLEQALGQPVEGRILLLDAATPDGYERVWRPAATMGPERHLGYALQWFGLGLVVLVGFAILSLRRVDASDPRADERGNA